MSSIPALFAKLFVVSAHWTFAAEQIDADGAQHTVKTKGEVTCEVSHVKVASHRASAELACTGMPHVDFVNGTYVATDDGLWRVDDAGDKLDPGAMLIAATPKAGKRTHHDPDGGDETVLVKRHAGAWCFARMTAEGDEDGWMLCIDAKHGLVGGNGFVAGGETHDTYFGITPRY